MITYLSEADALNPPTESGADHLRRVVATLNACREGALDGYAADQLIRLVDACYACEWLVLPSDLPKGLRDDIGRYGATPDLLVQVNAWCEEHFG